MTAWINTVLLALASPELLVATVQETVDAGDAERVTTQSSTTRKSDDKDN
ncbi:hypothetical protein ZEAMMB73_Zm00001d046605 [Zea mays]|uniref:Uncharacterized protein n=1 Tax=Zea mays TaxID=4577 RepID=A0A1D6P407_MAIZE|nr:hypothetical protein ZEAMMB73_Zm00001d046605 [Zea mays]